MTLPRYTSAVDQLAALAGGSVSAVQLVGLTLQRIAAAEAGPAPLRAFRQVRTEAALSEAAAADGARAAGRAGPLTGLPVAVKDNEAVVGIPTRYGTRSAEPPAARDGLLTAALRRAGAIVVGVTAMPELALWPFTEAPATGVTANPYSARLTPGGSSGGSAAAVAAGLVPAASATDGGGSIRIPAACCHLVGLKPTFGRVAFGTGSPHWHGLSHAGMLTRTVADTVRLLEALSPRDWTTPPAGTDVNRLRIAVSSRPPLPASVHPHQVAALHRVAAALAALGHDVVEADPPYGDVNTPFLPRYLRGARDDLLALVDPAATERRTRSLARFGAAVPPAVLSWSTRRAAALTARLAPFFAVYDLLLTPTVTGLPLPAGRFAGSGATRTLLAVSRYVPFTAVWNATGQPAASLPAGLAASGEPLAVQLIGPRDGDATVLAVASQLEERLSWPAVTPPTWR